MPGTTDAQTPSNTITSDDHGGTWAIETPELGLHWERSSNGEARLVSLRTAGREWISTPEAMFGTHGDPDASAALRDVTSEVDGATLRLSGTLDPTGLTASLTFTVYEDDSVVLADIELANATEAALEVGSLSSLRLVTARDGGSQAAVLAGGRWDEAMPPRGYRLSTIDLDEVRRGTAFGAAEDGRSSGEHIPWLALLGAGGGLLASLIWSGRWWLGLTPRGDENLIALGISDFAHTLQPGERLALPSVVVAGFAGNLDDGANAWRRWVAEQWMPAVPDDWPWIQYNHWYAYYGDIDVARLLDEARLAANAGCEVFVIDDGWFRGRRPDSYIAGWGDWVEDRAKFPDGIHAFGEQVRRLGMRFGLWVEPERADESVDLVRRHPEWVATREGEPIRRPGPAGPEGVHLCLGNPEVQRWMADDMIRVVRQYGVEWLKWDYNMGYGLGCDAADHGHQPTDGHYAHTLGLYRVFEELRAACPDLVIENCASGGHRVDLGTLRYSHTNWVSDYTDRAASCRQHAQGAGLFLPLAHVNTWALEDRDLTGFRSRMGGAFGVSSFMGEWSDDERETFRGAVSEYRRLRPFLTGERYLLTGPWHGDWDIWQLIHPSGDAFVIIAFHEGGAISKVRVSPRLVERGRAYTIERSSGASSRVLGADLAAHGISIDLPGERTSEIIWAFAGAG